MLDAISKSLSENLADLEKKLRDRGKRRRESAVLASVANVEEKNERGVDKRRR